MVISQQDAKKVEKYALAEAEKIFFMPEDSFMNYKSNEE